MLRQPAKGDLDRTSPFFTALGTLGRMHRDDNLPDSALLFVADGFAAEVGDGRVVAALGLRMEAIPGCDEQRLLLLDGQGRLLDRLSCSVSNRLTMAGGAFRTEAPASRQADGARLVIRYVPPEGSRVEGWSHDITWQGKTYCFSWDQERPEAIRSADWEEKGLCRVAVRDSKFVILFPALERATTGR
jgi:hypothetical protein